MIKKRLLIIGEGQTEQVFVKTILGPYLLAHAPQYESVNCPVIKKSKGGLAHYQDLKRDVINILGQSNIVLSTLIDFYALPPSFPNFSESQKKINKSQRLDFLQQAILEDINKSTKKENRWFIPYIQLHEFEALVFCSATVIDDLYESSMAEIRKIKKIVDDYPNPEDINDDPNSAPSKRLQKLIQGYSKVNDGIIILEEIGMENLLKKCPRFRHWVDSLVEAGQA